MLRVEPQIRAEYVAAGDVALAFHHVLDHGNSALLHQAVECAGAQAPRAYWELHDLLFENQNSLWRAGVDDIVALAQPLALDGDSLATCLTQGQFAEKVTAMDGARRDRGIRSRPSFAVNDRIIQGAIPFTTFQVALDEAVGR